MTAEQHSSIHPGPKSGTSYRLLMGFIVAYIFVYLFNNVVTFWFDNPGVLNLFAHNGWFGLVADSEAYTSSQIGIAWVQLFLYFLAAIWVVIYVRKYTGYDGLLDDSKRYAWLAAYVIRSAFWIVVLVGLADIIVSFLRVEDFLALYVGEELASELGRPQFRGYYLHYPLIVLSAVIALFTRSLCFVWLALLVVLAEFQVVILRFVFSYEQAFMGDLVRFWYAALFLFASSYALITGGHVRVDVLYTHFSERNKAWANSLGVMLLGMPICFTILLLSTWGRGSSINGPMLSFEITQSGFGMYVKYLMAGFVLIFALSMILQFASYFLENIAVLLRGREDKEDIELAHQPG